MSVVSPGETAAPRRPGRCGPAPPAQRGARAPVGSGASVSARRAAADSQAAVADAARPRRRLPRRAPRRRARAARRRWPAPSDGGRARGPRPGPTAGWPTGGGATPTAAGPVEQAGPVRRATQPLGPGERAQRRRDAVERGRARGLLGALEALPARVDRARRPARSSAPASNTCGLRRTSLAASAVGDVARRRTGRRGPRGQTRVDQHLQQQVAELLAHARAVARLDGLDQLVGLLHARTAAATRASGARTRGSRRASAAGPSTSTARGERLDRRRGPSRRRPRRGRSSGAAVGHVAGVAPSGPAPRAARVAARLHDPRRRASAGTTTSVGELTEPGVHLDVGRGDALLVLGDRRLRVGQRPAAR